MNGYVKSKVKEHLNSEYGKQMVNLNGLKYVKKEIFHARLVYKEGDKRQLKYY